VEALDVTSQGSILRHRLLLWTNRNVYPQKNFQGHQRSPNDVTAILLVFVYFPHWLHPPSSSFPFFSISTFQKLRSFIFHMYHHPLQSATVVNSSLVEDPTIRLPGFDLHRRQWSLLNSFSNGSGPLQCVPQEMGFHWQRTMWLWWNPNNVTYRQLLSIDQIRRRTTASTCSR